MLDSFIFGLCFASHHLLDYPFMSAASGWCPYVVALEDGLAFFVPDFRGWHGAWMDWQLVALGGR